MVKTLKSPLRCFAAESASPDIKATIANAMMVEIVTSVVARSIVAKSDCKSCSAFVMCNMAVGPMVRRMSTPMLKYTMATKIWL
jgi:hypothetical protein